MWERVALAILRARVLRCRDCRYRYWTEPALNRVILVLTVLIAAPVFAVEVALHTGLLPEPVRLFLHLPAHRTLARPVSARPRS